MAKSTSKSKSAKPKTSKSTKKTVAAKARSTKSVAKSTKVTKKPAASTKAASAKAVKETSKNVKKVANVKAPRTRVLTFARLRSLHLLSTGVFLLMALLAGLFMDATSYQVTLPHLTADALTGKLAGGAEPLYELQARWAVVGLLVVSAFISFMRFRNVAKEQAAVERRISPTRWVDFALSGAVMTATVAILAGLQDVVGLKLLAFVAVLSAVFAWIAERENAGAARAVKGAFEATVVSGAVVLLALVVLLLAAPVYGSVRAPWFVYALFGTMLVAGLLLARIQYRAYRHLDGKAADYLRVERNYLVVNLLAKTVFAAILIAGLAA